MSTIQILPDPRLNEMREMGLQSVWIEVAEAIGVDAFLKMWWELDVDDPNEPADLPSPAT